MRDIKYFFRSETCLAQLSSSLKFLALISGHFCQQTDINKHFMNFRSLITNDKTRGENDIIPGCNKGGREPQIEHGASGHFVILVLQFSTNGGFTNFPQSIMIR
jgi:hypothetical protein